MLVLLLLLFFFIVTVQWLAARDRFERVGCMTCQFLY